MTWHGDEEKSRFVNQIAVKINHPESYFSSSSRNLKERRGVCLTGRKMIIANYVKGLFTRKMLHSVVRPKIWSLGTLRKVSNFGCTTQLCHTTQNLVVHMYVRLNWVVSCKQALSLS
jgi:hypothetical protein